MIEVSIKGTGMHRTPGSEAAQRQVGGKYEDEPNLSRLLERFATDFGTPVTGYIGVDDKKAYTILMSLEYGTAASAEIGAKRAYTIAAAGWKTPGARPKVLAFFWHGDEIFVPYVRITKGIRPRHFIRKATKEAIQYFEREAALRLGDIAEYKRYPKGVVVQLMTDTLNYAVQRMTAHMGPRYKKFARNLVIVPPLTPGGSRQNRTRVTWR